MSKPSFLCYLYFYGCIGIHMYIVIHQSNQQCVTLYTFVTIDQTTAMDGYDDGYNGNV